MKVINVTDLDGGAHFITPLKGSLALREMYLWPAWHKPESNVLFSCEKKNERSRRVLLENKTYTFADIQQLVNLKNQVDISHNNGKVTLMVNKDLNKIQFCSELLNVLKLPHKDNYTGNTTGDPVDLTDIKLTFNDSDMLYLRCHEIDENNVLENSTSSNLMSVIPLNFSKHNNKLVSYRDLRPLFHPLTQRKMVYNLHFSIQDPQGNDLPFHKCIFIVLNKDELL